MCTWPLQDVRLAIVTWQWGARIARSDHVSDVLRLPALTKNDVNQTQLLLGVKKCRERVY
jgi:hypothetical protein